MKNKTIPYILLALLICGISIGGTVAYFTDNEKTKNTLSIATNTIDITEEFIPPDTMQIGDNTTKRRRRSQTTVQYRVLSVFSWRFLILRLRRSRPFPVMEKSLSPWKNFAISRRRIGHIYQIQMVNC